MNFDPQQMLGGLGGILGGLFGNSDKPYDKNAEWLDRAEALQQPYLNAGNQGLGNYQEWLNGQKDPAKFINDAMSKYSESPYAQYLQKQSLRAGQNAASASGLSGSTPLVQQMQQNAGNISSQDQNQWLQNVLGINTQYGQGENNLMSGGQNAANSLANIYNNQGENAYNREASTQNNFWNMLGGGLGILGSFL